MHCDADPERAAQRGGAGGAVHPSSLWHAGHRLGPRDRGPRPRGRARLLRPLLHARKTPSWSSPATSSRRKRARLAERALRQDRAARRGARAPAPAGAGAGRAPARHRQRRKGRAAELAALLSRALAAHGRARRIGGARSARPSARRRPDQPALSRAGARGEEAVAAGAYYHGLGARRHALLSLRDAGARRLAARARRRGRQGARRCSSPTASRRKRWSAPRRGSSPTRSMRRTARRRWRAGTAPRWRPARRSGRAGMARSASRRSTPEAVLAAARKWLERRRAVTGFLLPAEEEAA